MKREPTHDETASVTTTSANENAPDSERRAQSRFYSVLVVDINHFARFNDRNDRETGDRLLQQFGTFLKALFRHTDTSARLHNDVYAVLLRHTDREGALGAARRLQAAIALRRWEEDVLTVCIGAATSKPTTPDAEAVMEEAKLALQRAKQLGEGHIVHFDPATF